MIKSRYYYAGAASLILAGYLLIESFPIIAIIVSLFAPALMVHELRSSLRVKTPKATWSGFYLPHKRRDLLDE